MDLSNEELQQLLRLSLEALRKNSNESHSNADILVSKTINEEKTTNNHYSINRWLEKYKEIILDRGYKEQTIKNKKSTILHISKLWGEINIRDLKPAKITNDLKNLGVANSNLAVGILSCLRDVYSEAIANGVIEYNPTIHVKPPKHKVIRKRLAFDIWMQMWKISKSSRQKWLQPLLLLALVTGQRRADLAKMKFSDIHTYEDGKQFLRIEQQKQAGKGYGARVEISLDLKLNAINLSVGEVIELCKNYYKPGETLLRKISGKAIELSSLSARFQECITEVMKNNETVEINKRHIPSLHEVRSLSARLYTEQGEDVQTLLGHKNPEMTQIYIDDRGLNSDIWKRMENRELH